MTISVIIPSKNRIAKIRRCLAGLARQTIKPDKVIIIENNDRQTYQKLLTDFPHLPLVLKLEHHPGKAPARNRGIDVTKGDIVAFLDDDCQPSPRWIEEIKKIYSQHQTLDVVLGKTIEQSPATLIKAYTFQYDRWFLLLRVSEKTGKVVCGGALNSRNFAIKRLFLHNHQVRFDSRYDRFGFAEDTDFGEQLESLGAKMSYAPQVKVVHQETGSLIKLLGKKFTNGRAMYHLSQKGIFHTFKKKKRGMVYKIRRLRAVIKKLSIRQKPLFLLYLYLIVASYHLGFLYERLISHRTDKQPYNQPGSFN